MLISHPDICARAKAVNVLFSTSQRQSRQPKPTEVLLDTSDGMDWESFCDCSLIYAVGSDQLYGQRGVVSLERRRAIRGLLREMFLLTQLTKAGELNAATGCF